jgi:hypothetical protein
LPGGTDKPSKWLVAMWTRKREGIYLERLTRLAEYLVLWIRQLEGIRLKN